MEKEVVKEPNSPAEPPAGSKPDGGEVHVDGGSVGVRYASNEQFAKAHRKTGTLHAGLFRRLAK